MRTLEFHDPKNVEALARARQLYPEAPAHVHEAVANAIRARGDVPLTMHNAIRDGNYEGAIEYAAKIPAQDKDYAVRKFWETEQHDTSWTTDENGQLRFNPPRERTPEDGSDAGQSTERLASVRVERLPNQPNRPDGSVPGGNSSGGRAFRVDPFDFTGGNTISVPDGPVTYPGDTYEAPAGTAIDSLRRYIPNDGAADQSWIAEALYGPYSVDMLSRAQKYGTMLANQAKEVASKVATPYTREDPETVAKNTEDPDVKAAIEANKADRDRIAREQDDVLAGREPAAMPGTTTAEAPQMALPNVGNWFGEPQAIDVSRLGFAPGFGVPGAGAPSRTNFSGANRDGTNPRALKASFDMPQTRAPAQAAPERSIIGDILSGVNQLIGITPAYGAQVNQNQKKLGAVRSKPISKKLENVLEYAARKANVEVDVYSGGQPAKGTSRARVGSTRHDLGNAADIRLYSVDEKGKRSRVSFTSKSGRKTYQTFIEAAAAAGATGIGAGTEYMGAESIHVGFGKRADWGSAFDSRNQKAFGFKAAKNRGHRKPVKNLGKELARLRSQQKGPATGVASKSEGADSKESQGAGRRVDRRQLAQELERDPGLRQNLLELAQAEVGAYGDNAIQGFLETVFNRAQLQGTTLDNIVRGPKNGKRYYAPYHNGGKAFQRAQRHLKSNPKKRDLIAQQLDKVIAGSNTTNLATHNASAGVGRRAKQFNKGYAVEVGNNVGKEVFYTKTGRRKGDPDERSFRNRQVAFIDGPPQQTQVASVPTRNPRALGDPVPDTRNDGRPALNAQVAALSGAAAAAGAMFSGPPRQATTSVAANPFNVPAPQSQRVASTAPFTAPPSAQGVQGDADARDGAAFTVPSPAPDERGRDADVIGGAPQSNRDLTQPAPAPERSTPAPDALGRDADARAGAPQSTVDLTQAAPRSYSDASIGPAKSARSAQEVGMPQDPQTRVGSFSAPVVEKAFSEATQLPGLTVQTSPRAPVSFDVVSPQQLDAIKAQARVAAAFQVNPISVDIDEMENRAAVQSNAQMAENDRQVANNMERDRTPAFSVDLSRSLGVPDVDVDLGAGVATGVAASKSRTGLQSNAQLAENEAQFSAPNAPAATVKGNVGSFAAPGLAAANPAAVDTIAGLAAVGRAAGLEQAARDNQFSTPAMTGGVPGTIGPKGIEFSSQAFSTAPKGKLASFSLDQPFSQQRDIQQAFDPNNVAQRQAMNAMMTNVDPVASVGFSKEQGVPRGFETNLGNQLNANAALGPAVAGGPIGGSIADRDVTIGTMGPLGGFGLAGAGLSAPASTNFGGVSMGSTAGLTGISGFSGDSFGSGGFGGPDGFGLGSSSLGGTSSGLAGTSFGSFSDFGANSSFGTNNSAFGTSSFGTSSTAGLNANTGANADFGSFGAGFSNSYGGNDSGGFGGGIGGGIGGIGGSSSSSGGRGSDGGPGSNSGPGSSSGSSVSSSESATSSGHSDAGVGGSECFLTTACTTAAGLPDDCPELRAMRELRDDYIVSFADGRANVREYYKFAPKIVAAVDAREDARAIWHETLRRIREIKKLVDAGKMETAYQNYIRLYYAMKRYVA
jgi:hypothetical protein